MVKGKIKAMFVFEILGRPSEYIIEAMEKFIEKLGGINGISIEKKKIHEPKKVDGPGDFYTTFSEVEVILDNLELLFIITFNMFPAHVEIIEPESLEISNTDLSNIVSELAAKLHRYDELTKGLTGEREYLIEKLKEADPEALKKMGIKSLNEEDKKDKKD